MDNARLGHGKDTSSATGGLVRQPLEEPSEQDLAFRSEATAAGMEDLHFRIEVVALEAFTLTSALNTVFQEGEFKIQDLPSFIADYLRIARARLENSECSEDSAALMDVVLGRGEVYRQPPSFIEPTRADPASVRRILQSARIGCLDQVPFTLSELNPDCTL